MHFWNMKLALIFLILSLMDEEQVNKKPRGSKTNYSKIIVFSQGIVIDFIFLLMSRKHQVCSCQVP